VGSIGLRIHIEHLPEPMRELIDRAHQLWSKRTKSDRNVVRVADKFIDRYALFLRDKIVGTWSGSPENGATRVLRDFLAHWAAVFPEAPWLKTVRDAFPSLSSRELCRVMKQLRGHQVFLRVEDERPVLTSAAEGDYSSDSAVFGLNHLADQSLLKWAALWGILTRLHLLRYGPNAEDYDSSLALWKLLYAEKQEAVKA